MSSARVSHHAFNGVSALIFVASAALTVVWCESMTAAGGMPMPGGWTMSMAWMRMPEQTWLGMAGAFAGMWIAMMIAMMLPSLVPALHCYREESLASGRRPGMRTALAAAGYFLVWTLMGLAVFPIGVGAAALEMRHPEIARNVPMATGLAVVLAGLFQLSTRKRRHLVRCRRQHVHADAVGAGVAWNYGLRLGLDCVGCCANLMLIVIVAGVMDVRVMAAVTAAITIERLLPAGEKAAAAIGAIVIAAGGFLIARAAGVV